MFAFCSSNSATRVLASRTLLTSDRITLHKLPAYRPAVKVAGRRIRRLNDTASVTQHSREINARRSPSSVTDFPAPISDH
jgi:hypothetical protein